MANVRRKEPYEDWYNACGQELWDILAEAMADEEREAEAHPNRRQAKDLEL